MNSKNAIPEPTSPVVAATQPTSITTNVTSIYLSNRPDSSSYVTNDPRENSSLPEGSAEVLPLSNGVQMASYIPNEPQVSSTRSELNYSLTTARHPACVNVNHGYEHDSQKDSNYADPPSYEEAIKAMECYKENPPPRVISLDIDHMPSLPENGQFGVQNQYFYPQSYQSHCTSDVVDVELRKKICAMLVCCIVIVGFGVLGIRIMFFIN